MGFSSIVGSAVAAPHARSVAGDGHGIPEDPTELVAFIRAHVIGDNKPIPGPFGFRRQIYADYIASGKALGFIENVVRDHVLPAYGNTHSEMSYAGKVTTAWREWAREVLREAVGADDSHAVIFAGSGATGAVDVLIRALQLYAPPRQRRLAAASPDLPVIFVGPYEHHSNDLPWREAEAEVVRIPLDEKGGIDIGFLAGVLPAFAKRPLRIGAFSAASNVTGIKSDVRAIARLLHGHNAVLVCDYAAAAPYVPMSMAATAEGADDHIDALFFSPHKFVGGPGSSGVLVTRKDMLTSAVPAVAGGGTVSYVSAQEHRYVASLERREEGGTPAIVGNIRAGLAMRLQQDVGIDFIAGREGNLVARVLSAWRESPNIRLLGPVTAERLAIFSFIIQIEGKSLHHSYVVALLNDLFGVQARGGCSCAGPYGQELLGHSPEVSNRISKLVAEGHGIMRPGWTRLGLNYFFSDEMVDAIADSVSFVAEHGLDLMPFYDVDVATGNWRARPDESMGRSLSLSIEHPWSMQNGASGQPAPSFAHCLVKARNLVEQAKAMGYEATGRMYPEFGGLRDFWMPGDAR